MHFNYCSVNLLLEEIECDEQLPVLQKISRGQGSFGKVIAVLYEITENDQVSHFKSVGKKFFYKMFLNNVDFISRGSVNTPGSLVSDLYCDFVSDPETETNASCSVIRLISCVYLSKNKPPFRPKTTQGWISDMGIDGPTFVPKSGYFLPILVKVCPQKLAFS